jgi:hypothetical protein
MNIFGMLQYLVQFIIRVEIIVEPAYEIIIKTPGCGKLFIARFFGRQYPVFVILWFRWYLERKLGLCMALEGRKLQKQAYCAGDHPTISLFVCSWVAQVHKMCLKIQLFLNCRWRKED